MNHISSLWNEEDQVASEPDFYGKWVDVNHQLPESQDASVLVYFAETGSIETVHIQDYFDDITAGTDDGGNQLYTKWYKSQNVTYWMALPDAPTLLQVRKS